LPDAWSSGKINGLKARGGFTVDIEWENGKLKNLLVTSASDTKAMIKYGANMVEGDFSKGKSIQFDGSLKIME